MNAMQAARDAVVRQARALWSWRQATLEGAGRSVSMSDGGEAPFTGHGLVVTAAQDLGFFARSSTWRCTRCSRVHRFSDRVPVIAASPCRCASIEFEPHRDGVFATPILSDGTTPAIPA
ncbi:MAG TPA: hypothetical protein VFF72_09525 [Caldimonas sp.]|nr:hypothetical protein [Caldimonas sp.]